MESAKLITSSMFADATPIQEAHHSTDVSTSVSPMVGEVISSSDQDSTELMQGETRANSVNRQQDRMKGKGMAVYSRLDVWTDLMIAKTVIRIVLSEVVKILPHLLMNRMCH